MFLIFTISDELDAFTYVGNLTNENEQITRTQFLMLQLFIRPVPAPVIYFGKAAKTLHRMSPCTPCGRSCQNHLELAHEDGALIYLTVRYSWLSLK